MSEIKRLLDKQATWQRTRSSRSWPEKIRMAERIRESVALWRGKARSAKLATPKIENG